jgi:replication protein O
VTIAQHARNLNPPESEDFHFAGFATPVYTQVPDAVFDELLPVLSGAELKVLLYVIRRTFGFKKASDDISISQIMHGITTREGEVLDRGTGLSKDAVTRATKRLVEMGVLVARRNRSRERGNEPTTYALHIRDGVSDPRTPPGPKIGQGLVRKSDPQETAEQETAIQEEFEASKASPNVHNSVDNPDGAAPPQVTIQSPPVITLMADFSREMGDTKHLGSNITQAHRIFAESGLGLDAFFSILYEARIRTRKTNGVGNRMAYFFTVLRDLALQGEAQ